MSETTAKAARRDLRRALGVEALEVFNRQGEAVAKHDAVVEAHAHQLQIIEQSLYAQHELIIAQDARAEDHAEQIRLTAQRQDLFRAMSWRSRWRWLLRGR